MQFEETDCFERGDPLGDGPDVPSVLIIPQTLMSSNGKINKNKIKSTTLYTFRSGVEFKNSEMTGQKIRTKPTETRFERGNR